ncbi:MAG: glutamate racemase [Veillonellaceae bacterium]|jgi:glutamate racemase|nr:glutamate racemase [Veillonellaceae bacterium]
MDCNLPIGVFDSGVGGLTVFKQLRSALPNEDIIYFGDTKRNPYGSRTDGEIIAFIHEILDFMAVNKVKVAVAACNTITVLLDKLHKQYPFQIIGMSKVAHSAMAASTNKRIGVIATEATIRSGRHLAEFMALSEEVEIFPKACPEFAPLVENENFDGAEVERAAQEYLTPLVKADVDTVVLACTHYPLLTPVIGEVMGKVKIFDPAEETAQNTKAYLEKENLLKSTGPGYNKLYFSADIERAKRIADRIIDINKCEFACIDVSKHTA